jgi:hypothetical protein
LLETENHYFRKKHFVLYRFCRHVITEVRVAHKTVTNTKYISYWEISQ